MTDYPINISMGGTAHYVSIKDAMKLVRNINAQVDAEFAKTRKKPTAKAFQRIVGENIKRERGVLNLTAAWVAKQSGLSVSFLSDVENGKRGISSENLVRVAKAVGCTIEDLVKGT